MLIIVVLPQLLYSTESLQNISCTTLPLINNVSFVTKHDYSRTVSVSKTSSSVVWRRNFVCDTRYTTSPPKRMRARPITLTKIPSVGSAEYLGFIEKMAFSVRPKRQDATAPTKMNRPKNWWIGRYAALTDGRKPGKRNVSNPTSHWHANNMTVQSPTHECRLYMLGIGGWLLLWKSNTATSPTMEKMKALSCISMCRIFSFFFFSERNPR